ncbi:lysozyme inhibitor LprI family protein [Silanimonas sp.]|jgi:uncharacterized protein YecT (DUF1311 family)|uniref:lysozyme inhibitor LprI family protein n=1 Tax=Silanimonas sp. TaxID=1929290 RepID=UPI0037C71854
MSRAFSLLLVCTLLFPADASASDRQFDSCMDRAGGVTSGMLTCMGEAQERADSRLSATLNKAISSVSPARRASLNMAQETWLDYRKANCDFLADPEGGTSASLMAADCWLSLTQERVAFLDTLVDHSTVLLR